MRTSKKTHKTTDAVEILNHMIGDDAALREMVAVERETVEVARKIYELRTAAGLTQTQLAKKVGTTQSVISQLEDADYDGHSMSMLRRIASALERRVEIRFLPIKRFQSA